MSTNKQKNFPVVLPEKCSDKNILSSVMDFFGGLPQYASQTPTNSNEEKVIWLDTFTTNNDDKDEDSSLFCLVGTTKGYQIWSLPPRSDALLLYSKKKVYCHHAALLPTTQSAQHDHFSSQRPILAVVETLNNARFQQIKFTSLLSGEDLQIHTFSTDILRLECNKRHIVAVRHDCITIIDNHDLQPKLSIRDIYIPTAGQPALSLGTRWLAFVDTKRNHDNKSAGGDATDESNRPLVSSVYCAKQKFFNHLNVFGTTIYEAMVNQVGTSTANAPASSSAAPASSSSSASSISSQQKVSSPKTISSTTKHNYNQFSASSDSVGGGLNSSMDTTNVTNEDERGIVTIIDLETLLQRIPKIIDSFDEDVVNSADIGGDGSSNSSFILPFINVHNDPYSASIVAHFQAHHWAQVSMLRFDPSGLLLFTACAIGTSFNIFRISAHPFDSRQTAIHHLYVLRRGETPCSIVHCSFAHDSRWVAVASDHGTVHLFPITPYGGSITVRTHTQPRVVNRTSRHQKSAGIDEIQLLRPSPRKGQSAVSNVNSSGISTGLGGIGSSITSAGGGGAGGGQSPAGGNKGGILNSLYCDSTPPHDHNLSSSELFAMTLQVNRIYNTTNPRLPPYPAPCDILAELQLRPGVQHPPWALCNQALMTSLDTTGSGGNGTGSNNTIGYLSNTNISSGSNRGLSNNNTTTLYNNNKSRTQQRWGWSPLRIIASSAKHHAALPLAMCFAESRCILPGDCVYNASRDSSSRHKAVDSIFIVTSDLSVIEYDLIVVPKEGLETDTRANEDGDIILRGTTLGQWPLHSMLLSMQDFSPFKNISSLSSLLLPSGRNPFASFMSQQQINFKSNEKDSFRSEEGDLCVLSTTEETLPERNTSWICQVEITTHQGPHRRLWMGPQFTFRPYQEEDSSHSYLPNYLHLESFSTGDNFSSSSACLQSIPYQSVSISSSSSTATVNKSSNNNRPDYDATTIDTVAILENTSSSSRPQSPQPTTKPLSLPSRIRSSSTSTFGGGQLNATTTTMTTTTPAYGRMDIPSPRERHQSQNSTGSSHSRQDERFASERIFIEAGSYQESFFSGSLGSIAPHGGELVSDTLLDAMRELDFSTTISSSPSTRPPPSRPVPIPGATTSSYLNTIPLRAGGSSGNDFITEEQFPDCDNEDDDEEEDEDEEGEEERAEVDDGDHDYDDFSLDCEGEMNVIRVNSSSPPTELRWRGQRHPPTSS